MLNPQQRKQQRLVRERQEFSRLRQQALNQFTRFQPQQVMSKPPTSARASSPTSTILDAALPIILLILAAVWLASSPLGLSTRNLSAILSNGASIGMAALGITLTMIAGGIDFSVGSIIGLSGLIFAMLLRSYNEVTAVLLSLMVCIIFGAVQGALVAYLEAPAYIVTLAGIAVADGCAMMLSEGRTFTLERGSGLEEFTQGRIDLLPNVFILFVLVAVVSHIVVTQTSFGRNLRALAEGTSLSNGSRKTVSMGVYAFSALLAGAGGILLTGRLGAAFPASGQAFLLPALAAVVVAGVGKGRGSLLSTVLAIIAIQALAIASIIAGWTAFSQNIVIGGLIILGLLRNLFH
jgi:ribose transport system permease protein